MDRAASSIGFRVRHFRFATVEGSFGEFAGRIDERGASGTVDVASIETGHEVRDERLRSPDFFDVGRFPQMTLDAPVPVADLAPGRLTVRDVTRPVALRIEMATSGAGAAVLRATTVISRKAFGLDWPALREAGRLIVSDRVELRLELGLLPG